MKKKKKVVKRSITVKPQSCEEIETQEAAELENDKAEEGGIVSIRWYAETSASYAMKAKDRADRFEAIAKGVNSHDVDRLVLYNEAREFTRLSIAFGTAAMALAAAEKEK